MSYSRFFNDHPHAQNHNDEQISPGRRHNHAHHTLHRPATDYDPYKIPPDWELARLHAKSREVGEEKQFPKDVVPEVCKCCGFQIEREPLSLWDNPKKLQFLGAGYPLFYNFLKFSWLILLVLLLVSGIYNMISDSNGHFCKPKNHEIAHSSSVKSGAHSSANGHVKQAEHFLRKSQFSKYRINFNEHGGKKHECELNWISKYTAVNKLGSKESIQIQMYLNLLTAVIIMILLIFFRRSQRQLNADIDVSQQTPTDYSVIVKNIPKGLSINYEKELIELFAHSSVPGHTIQVRKINIVYDIEEIEEIEHKIKEVVEKKKEILANNGFDVHDEAFKETDREIESFENEIAEARGRIISNPDLNAGICIVSFNTEQEKDSVISCNHVPSIKRTRDFILSRGKGRKYPYKDGHIPRKGLFFKGNRLSVEEAPEPADIEWEFIASNTHQKIKARIKSFLKTIFVLFLCFTTIFFITAYKVHIEHQANHDLKHGKEGAKQKHELVKAIAIFISVILVLFNKFALGKIIHHIVDTELWSTKTRASISMAEKLASALFFNTALITFAVEILAFGNYFGEGGMIFTEFYVFIMNALIPQTAWLIDPWGIIQYLKRRKALAQGDKCLLTQKEANESTFPN